jgi:hypothetical protein
LTGRVCSRNGKKRNVGNSEGKRPPGRPSHRWEYNIMTDKRDRLVWCGLVQDRARWRVLVSMEMNIRVP